MCSVTVSDLPITFRTSVRYAWGGTVPRNHGWPLLRTTLTSDGIHVAAALRRGRSPNGFSVTAEWNELKRVERTRRGIRLVFRDDRQAVVVGTLRPQRLWDVVRDRCPVPFDSTLRPSTWSTV
jgi:hypothetical protein